MTQDQKAYMTILEAVMQLASMGFNVELVPFINHAIELCPDNSLAYILKGLIHQKEDEFDLAEETLNKALKLEPENLQALQALGLLLVERERYDEAFPLLIKHLSINPQSSLSLDGVVLCLSNFQMKNHKNLESLLLEAWRKTKLTEIGIKYARHLMFYEGKIQDAKKILQNIIDLSPTPESLAELAFAYSVNHEYEKAIETLERAINLDPEYDRLWRGLAQCYNEIGNFEEAIRAADKALLIDPYHYRNLQSKAEVLLSLESENSLKEALKLIKQAKSYCQIDARADPDAKPVLKRLYIMEGTSLKYLGKQNEAIKTFQHALENFPTDVNFLLNLFMLFYENNQPNKAWDLFNEHKDDRAEFSNAIASIGVNNFYTGNIEIALDIYKTLIQKSQMPVIMMNYGYMLASAGQILAAIDTLNRVLSQPNIEEETKAITKTNLAYLYAINNQPDLAIKSCENIFESSAKGTVAVLHIPFWFSGEIYPDPISIPGRNMTVLQASQSAFIAATLAIKNIKKVLPFLPVIQSWENDSSYKYLILAGINSAIGDDEATRLDLNKALSLVQHKSEKELISELLEIIQSNDKDKCSKSTDRNK